jgi:hypothetical protein
MDYLLIFIHCFISRPEETDQAVFNLPFYAGWLFPVWSLPALRLVGFHALPVREIRLHFHSFESFNIQQTQSMK